MRVRFLAVVGLAIAGAQAGHLLAYSLRFGGAAAQLQANGVHAYFPTLAKTVAGATAFAFLGALLVVAAARVVAQGNRRARVTVGPSFITVLAALFTMQLIWFVGQEVVEALAAGVPPPGSAELLLWGMIGQLPVAFVGATLLAWLGRRVDEAVAALGAVTSATTPLVFSAPLALRPLTVDVAIVSAHASRSRIVKRGPPHLLTS